MRTYMEREALARVIEAGWGDPTWDGETLRPIDRTLADAILDAGYTTPRVATTVEDLDALPEGAVILTEVGGVWERWPSGRIVSWRETGRFDAASSMDLALPATILYTPKATQ
jgi:hypothetical protein